MGVKKLLICLLLCLIPAAWAEEDCPIELRMELSQTRFTEPAEVAVDIVVSNVSGEDMPGPMALYYPNGKIIAEFGTPTLLAGESCTWQGTWNVTTEQLNAGKVVFAVMYTYRAADGSLACKVQSWYAPVDWTEKPPQTAEIILKGNPSTGYSWDWQGLSGNSCVNIECESTSVIDDSTLVGGPVRFTYVVKGVQPGYVEICFTYARPWEHDPAMAIYKLYYDIHVDEELNVSILNTRFDW